MANVTIPNLTSATTIAPSTDLMVLEQTEGTRKATLSQIFTSSATSGSGLGITSGGVYTIKSGLDSDISDINTLLGGTSIASIGDGTVTGAISTLNQGLTELNTDLGEYLIRRDVSVPATTLSANQAILKSVSCTVISGYDLFGVIGFYSSSTNIITTGCYVSPDTNEVNIGLRNMTSSSQTTGNIVCVVSYVKHFD